MLPIWPTGARNFLYCLIFFGRCDFASEWFRKRPDAQTSDRSGRIRSGQVRRGSGVRCFAAGRSEKLGQSFARLQREELDRHAFEEMAHHAAAHIAKTDGGTDWGAYVDVDSGA